MFNEFISKCRHSNKFKLSAIKGSDGYELVNYADDSRGEDIPSGGNSIEDMETALKEVRRRIRLPKLQIDKNNLIKIKGVNMLPVVRIEKLNLSPGGMEVIQSVAGTMTSTATGSSDLVNNTRDCTQRAKEYVRTTPSCTKGKIETLTSTNENSEIEIPRNGISGTCTNESSEIEIPRNGISGRGVRKKKPNTKYIGQNWTSK